MTINSSWHLTFHDSWHFMKFLDIWHFMTFDISWLLTFHDISWHLTFEISWHLTFHDSWHFMTFNIWHFRTFDIWQRFRKGKSSSTNSGVSQNFFPGVIQFKRHLPSPRIPAMAESKRSFSADGFPYSAFHNLSGSVRFTLTSEISLDRCDDDLWVNTQQSEGRAELQVGGESFYHSSGP